MVRKKICQFSIVHAQTDSRVFARECKSLAKDFDVTLIAVGEKEGLLDGVNMIPLPRFSNPILRMLVGGPLIYQKALQQDAGVYHFHDPELIPYGILLSFTGARVFYDMHENTMGDIAYRGWIPKWMRNAIAKIYKNILSYGNLHFHTIAVVEKDEMAYNSGLRPGHFTKVLNYAPLHELIPFRIENRWEQTEARLIYAGLLEDHYYHFSKILEAIYLLQKEGIIVQLDVAGKLDQNQFESYTRLDYWDKIKSNLVFHGYIPQQQFFELSRKARIGLCLKNQPDKLTYSHERKLFEYIGLGLPSLFCDNAIYRALNEELEIGISCSLDDPRSISEGIKGLLADKSGYERFVSNCLNQAHQKFNWESQYEKLKSLMLMGN